MRVMLLILAVGALILFLNWQFPYAATGEQDQMRLLYLVALLALVASGALHIRRDEMPRIMKYAFAWVGIILLLVMGYSFRDEIMTSRLAAELVPQKVRMGKDGTLNVRAGEDGHFSMEALVNGVPVLFMVDTGASDIVLSPRDAKRAGFSLETLNFSRTYRTANGVVKGAPVKIALMKIGTIEIEDIPASVNGASMERSLLGMSFLRLFKGYEVEGNSLKLQP